ncbi:MAG: DUF2147 domain-containing protein [Hyphomicrobiaceae bacterium]
MLRVEVMSGVTGHLSIFRKLAVLVLVAGVLALQPTNVAQASTIEGVWIDDTGQGAVEIARCGRSLCGTIVWLRDPLQKNGQPLVDALNTDPRQRRRPICGLQVIGGLEPVDSGAWDFGWIYDPKQGKQFDVKLSLMDRNTLEVLGYLGVKFLSRTLVWTRAPDNLPACG